MLNQEPPKNNPLAYKSSALGERCTGANADNGRLMYIVLKLKYGNCHRPKSAVAIFIQIHLLREHCIYLIII